MGDIALPDIVYENEWRAQRLNKTFQQEIEKLKQEVILEGLQVEEEGLTDIIRKKTKQVAVPEVESTTIRDNRKLNDPVVVSEDDIFFDFLTYLIDQQPNDIFNIRN